MTHVGAVLRPASSPVRATMLEFRCRREECAALHNGRRKSARERNAEALGSAAGRTRGTRHARAGRHRL
ncbi:MAG: hypothetical protein ACK528_11525, partial [Alphaproteobacteria bacterium]